MTEKRSDTPNASLKDALNSAKWACEKYTSGMGMNAPGIAYDLVSALRVLMHEASAVSEKPTTDKPLIRAKLGIDDKPLPRRLWLWKNFVDGRPEYWAFDNPYPCYPNGDPFTLGEPCGYAIVKDSTQGRFDVTEEEVIAAIKRAAVSATEAIGLLRAIYINWPLHGISPELDDQIQALLARSDSTGDQDGK